MSSRPCLALPALLLAACSGSSIADLQGGWSGTVTCFGDTSEISLGILIESEHIGGSGQIRTKGSNADFALDGGQVETTRVAACNDPFCDADDECAAKLRTVGVPGTCVAEAKKVCKPCFQSNDNGLFECTDPSCSTDSDCAKKLTSRCVQGTCTPCYEATRWKQVTITLRDNNSAIPDPVLTLWRYSDQRMEGTITKFCPDEDRRVPQVTVEKTR